MDYDPHRMPTAAPSITPPSLATRAMYVGSARKWRSRRHSSSFALDDRLQCDRGLTLLREHDETVKYVGWRQRTSVTQLNVQSGAATRSCSDRVPRHNAHLRSPLDQRGVTRRELDARSANIANSNPQFVTFRRRATCVGRRRSDVTSLRAAGRVMRTTNDSLKLLLMRPR